MIAGGSAPGFWSRIDADPDRVEICVGERTVGDAPGYHMLPLQGKRPLFRQSLTSNSR